MVNDLSHKPIVLYHAAAERWDAARNAYDQEDYVLTVYLAGLSVECILQAIALLDDPAHDARHDLSRWLGRCRMSLQEAIKDRSLRDHWNLVVRIWRNDVRYLSRAGLLGYLRELGESRGISGGPDAIMKINARRLLDSAGIIYRKRVAVWGRYNTE